MDLSLFRLKTTDISSSPLVPGGSGLSPFLRATLSQTADSQAEEAVEVALRGQSTRFESASDTSPSSGVRSMLQEIRKRSLRLSSLQESRDKSALGSEQYLAYSKEIEAEEKALGGIVDSDPFKKLQEILAQGIQNIDASTLVGGGGVASLTLLNGYVNTLATAIKSDAERDESFYSVIDKAVAGALRALDSRSTASPTSINAASPISQLIAPQPEYQQMQFGGGGGLSISIQGYFGANALQAAMAHVDYDPRDAVVLLIDQEEDESDKREAEEKANKAEQDKLGAGLRAQE